MTRRISVTSGLLWLAITALACSSRGRGGGDDDTDAPFDTPDAASPGSDADSFPSDVRGLCDLLASDVCERVDDCSFYVNDIRFGSVDDCREWFVDRCCSGATCAEPHGVSLRAVDVCLADLRGRDCNSLEGAQPASCDDLLAVEFARQFDLPRGRVFLSSVRVAGDMSSFEAPDFGSGAEAGDHVCAFLAEAAGLGGEWRSFLSTAEEDAPDRLADRSPWITIDGQAAFPTYASLRTQPSVAVILTEVGSYFAGVYEDVWTGTVAGGELAANCQDWRSADCDDQGIHGISTEDRLDQWTAAFGPFGGAECCDYLRLYCFEQ